MNQAKIAKAEFQEAINAEHPLDGWVEDWASEWGATVSQNCETEEIVITFPDHSELVWHGAEVSDRDEAPPAIEAGFADTIDRSNFPEFTYSIFDDDPNQTSGTVWPTHDREKIRAASRDSAEALVWAEMRNVAAQGLRAANGYAPGQKLHALVWDDDGAVSDVTYTLRAKDVR